jgi:hypothetical protein
MKTIKLQTIIDRARRDGIEYYKNYLEPELTLTGVGLEKPSSIQDTINPSAVLLNFLISRKYEGLWTVLDTTLTPLEFREIYGISLFEVRSSILD